ncbi:MAG: magnesium transporter [Gemmatimonadota bacterium]|nr:magnesium transporter [Gemmatimonadota bacterium]
MSNPSPEDIQEHLKSIVASGDMEALSQSVLDLHPSDLADLVEALDEAQQVQLFSVLPTELASETLAEMEEGEDRGDLLAALEPERGAELLHELADDDAADLIGELEPEEQRKILDALPVEEAGDLRGLLLYDEESAGGLMTTELVSVAVTLTALEALAEVRIQGREVEDFYSVFVVDDRRRLLGTVRLDSLVIAEPDATVAELVEPVAASVRPDVDQEEVGRLISRYNLASLPVVNEFDVLLGRITFDDVIDVIEAEQTEDILRLAGITDEEDLRDSWMESVKARLPWLLLHLVTATGAASVILVFQDTIQHVLILAFVAPIIAAMGGSSGTQALAVTIRRITVEGGVSTRDSVAKELLVGAVNGGVLGVAIAGISFLVGGDPMLGGVVLLAMWGNQVVAGFAGAFIPTTLDRLGLDPSVASSVFIQTLTDLCGFFLLLGLATELLL